MLEKKLSDRVDDWFSGVNYTVMHSWYEPDVAAAYFVVKVERETETSLHFVRTFFIGPFGERVEISVDKSVTL